MVDCVEFEELNLADVYGVGDVFSVANSDGSLKFDAKVGGFGISGVGSATVENGGKAGAMGQELRVDNVTVSFKTVTPAPDGLLIHFGEYGGTISFSVNGSVINADNFQDLDGQTAGGITLSVPMGGNVMIRGFWNSRVSRFRSLPLEVRNCGLIASVC